MTLSQQLTKYGLTETEATVYVAALTVGPASAQEIAEKAEMHRVTTYGIIKDLLKKGFMREERIGKRRKFSAYPPMKLWDIVSQQQERLKKQMAELELLVPKLKSLTKEEKGTTKVLYYEGYEGLTSYSTDVLHCKGEMLEWTRIENYASVFDRYLDEVYFPLKKKLQVPTRFLFIDTPDAHAYIKKRYIDDPDAAPMKARFVPREQFDCEGFIVIYDDKYSVNIPRELRAVVIQDPIIADTQRKMFEFAWMHAKNQVQNKEYPKV
ncbi:MAG: hypothetical protein HYV34_02620 [Candidatus Kerfeldbacteria bacterium]|nr:hypothetical protein [Candidatus Kerfeldbacteria bacterium]